MYNIPYFVEVIGDAFDSLWYHSLKAKPFAFGYFRTRKLYMMQLCLYVANISSEETPEMSVVSFAQSFLQ